MGSGGEIFVLDMGDPVKIVELAKKMIRLSGMELKNEDNPNGDVEIIFTGLRPGEKLFEELIIGENSSETEHKQIMRASEDGLSWPEIDQYLKEIEIAQLRLDHQKLREIFHQTVSGYKPKEDIQDVLYLASK